MNPLYASRAAVVCRFLFSLTVLCLASSVQADPQPLTGTTLRGPNNAVSVMLETRAPYQSSSATVTVSAHTPPGQKTFHIPNQPLASGFRFTWPWGEGPRKLEMVNGNWAETAKAAQGTVTVTPQRMGYTDTDRLFPTAGAGEEDGAGTATESAIVTVSFPQPGRYRVEIGVVANWWSGTGEEWEGNSNILPLEMNVLNVQKLQYRLAQNGAGQGDFADVPNPLVVGLNQQVEFKALPLPSDVSWPTEADNKPQWSSVGSGVTGATGKADSKVVTFGELGDKSVTATYGNAATANVKVANVKLQYKIAEGEFTDVNDTLYLPYGTVATFRVVSDSIPVEEPTWGGTESVEVRDNEGDVRFLVRSQNAEDFKTITATVFGTTVTAKIIVFRITEVSVQGAARVFGASDSNPYINHFVTPKGQVGETVTLQATILPQSQKIIEGIAWEGATQNPANPLIATVSKSDAARRVVKINVNTQRAREMRVWVMWSDISSFRTAGPKEEHYLVRIAPGLIPAPATAITTTFTFAATILPSSIITDQEKPYFYYPGPDVYVPNYDAKHIVMDTTFGQPNSRVDISRAWRVRALSANTATTSYEDVRGTIYQNLPDSNKVVQTTPSPSADFYPISEVEGNDDSASYTSFTIEPEDNNPYDESDNGKLTDVAAVTLPVVFDPAGQIGDSIAWNFQFREFVRIQLGEAWCRISDYSYWRLHSKLKKVAQAPAGLKYVDAPDAPMESPVWINDGSVSDHTNQNF